MDDAESEFACFPIGRYVQSDPSLKPNHRACFIEHKGEYPRFIAAAYSLWVYARGKPLSSHRDNAVTAPAAIKVGLSDT
jgi:hypothetical protein